MTTVTQNSASSQLAEELEKNSNFEGNFQRENIARTFDELKLKPNLLKGILSYGFNRPSPIQSRAIIPCVSGSDVTAQAQSGTGKTATYVISTIERIDTETTPVVTQALCVAPTRELAQQIREVYVQLGQYCDLKCDALVGGRSTADDVAKLKTNSAHVYVGTPGRILHMICDGNLVTKDIKIFILDEADEMLGRGFRDQIYTIFKALPSNVQVILISATLPDEVRELSKKFMRDSVDITVKKEQLTLQGIRQFMVKVDSRNNKLDAIVDIIGQVTVPQMVIFVNLQKDGLVIERALADDKIDCAFLHSGLEQKQREEVMRRFRTSEVKVLLSTNLISRGIDVQSVALVINFDMPRDFESYLHRIGRGGRYGRKGVAINMVLEEELDYIRQVSKYYNTTIDELPQNVKSLFE